MTQRARSVCLAGRVSCLLLLLLAFLTINPVNDRIAFAEGEDDISNDNANDTNSGIDLQSASVDSTMNISFSPTAGTATAPIGTPTRFQVTATVDVENSGGYTIYFGSNNQNLTRIGGTETIAPISGTVDFNSLENNTWGYTVAEGNTVADNATYTAVPGSVRGRTIYTNNSTNIPTESKTYTLSFAARIGTDKPAGTYSNQVTMSVVSSPLEVVTNDFGEITTMQEMTSAICANATDQDNDGEISAQLKDVRDGKFYWVNKLADGHCWMTQNLDLDLSTETKLTSDTSDVPAAGWTPEYTTALVASKATILKDNAGQLSWDLGDYSITYPTIYSSCGSSKATGADCPSQLTSYITPTTANGEKNAHYILGNHYQWNSATAGTGGTVGYGEASGSVCPKGWRLPMRSDSTVGSFQGLFDAGSIGTDSEGAVEVITSAPYYFARSGYVSQDSSYLSGVGGYGYSRSSTGNSASYYYAYMLIFGGSMGTVNWSGGNAYRYTGASVRCVAR